MENTPRKKCHTVNYVWISTTISKYTVIVLMKAWIKQCLVYKGNRMRNVHGVKSHVTNWDKLSIILNTHDEICNNVTG